MPTAIYGENFCWSAGRAFKMLSNNALRVIAINSVGDFILFLGKAGVVTAVVFIGIELIKVLISSLYPTLIMRLIFFSFEIKDKPGVVYIWTPILIAAIFAYLIAHCFISVFEVNRIVHHLLAYHLLSRFIFLDVHRYSFHLLLRRLRDQQRTGPTVFHEPWTDGE